jgi:hydrogenase expression/formation protein HypC
MCLAVPGRVVEIEGGELCMARVDFGGISREVCLAYLPEATLGDYVLVHAGFAISSIDEQAARETLELLGQIEAVGPPADGSDAPR